MKVETFLICDSVQSLPDGKHIVQGERHEFIVPNVPSKSHPISMPVFIALARSERGQHRIGFTVKNEQGENAIDGYEMGVELRGDAFSFVYQDVLRFPSLGNYKARLTVDGGTVATWSFVVKLLQ